MPSSLLTVVIFSSGLALACTSGGGEPRGADAPDAPLPSGAEGAAVATGHDGGTRADRDAARAGPPPDAASEPRDAGTSRSDAAASEPAPPAQTRDAGAPDAPPAPAPPAPAQVFVSGSGPEIRAFELDLATGALAARATTREGASHTYLAWDRAGRFLYALDGGSPARAIAFSIDRGTGALTKINEAATPPGGGSPHLAVHPSGRWLLLAHYASGHVTVSRIASDGAIGAVVDSEKTPAEAHQVAFDATGRFVFVPCRGGNAIAQYRFDPETGALTPNAPPLVPGPAPGAGPRHMAFDPQARFAYVINELGGTITSYRYDAQTGRLTAPETIRTTPAGVEEASTAHVLVHPSGRFVFGSNRGSDTLSTFTVDEAGRLKLARTERAGGPVKTPRDFAMDAEGRYLLVANQDASTIGVFAIDGATGALGLVRTVALGFAPQFVGVLQRP